MRASAPIILEIGCEAPHNRAELLSRFTWRSRCPGEGPLLDSMIPIEGTALHCREHARTHRNIADCASNRWKTAGSFRSRSTRSWMKRTAASSTGTFHCAMRSPRPRRARPSISRSTARSRSHWAKLANNKNLTIAGPGAERFTISANAASRIFNFDDANNSKNSLVTISGLTLTGGNATGGGNGHGGAIRSRESLHLEDLVLTDNNAQFDGGAVWFSSPANGATLTILTSYFARNRGVGAGGGFYAQVPANGVATIEDNEFYRNTTANRGGGARINAISQSVVTIARSTFHENASSPSTGGGAYLSTGTGASQ